LDSAFSFFMETLKVLPGALLFPFSIYFAWTKIGKNVGVSFSFGGEIFSANRIKTIIFTNRKDKPLPIFSVFLLIHKDVVIPVENFDPPLILKGLEVLQITTSKFSAYCSGSGQFELTTDLIKDAELFLVTSSGALRCEIIYTPSDVSYAFKNDATYLIKNTSRFNGLVYNEDATFAISYFIDGKQRTALVARSGIIGGDWDFHYNKISKELLSKNGIAEFIKHHGYDSLVKGISIDELHHTQS
jgi:hypothetical protein